MTQGFGNGFVLARYNLQMCAVECKVYRLCSCQVHLRMCAVEYVVIQQYSCQVHLRMCAVECKVLL